MSAPGGGEIHAATPVFRPLLPGSPGLISKVQTQEDLLLCRAHMLIVLEPHPSSGLSLLVTDQ